MSERLQRTVRRMSNQMHERYGETVTHKHNKNHHEFRQHQRTHPIQLEVMDSELQKNKSTGLIKKLKLQKFINRIAGKNVH